MAQKYMYKKFLQIFEEIKTNQFNISSFYTIGEKSETF